jgi:hypothetical protein
MALNDRAQQSFLTAVFFMGRCEHGAASCFEGIFTVSSAILRLVCK